MLIEYIKISLVSQFFSWTMPKFTKKEKKCLGLSTFIFPTARYCHKEGK